MTIPPTIDVNVHHQLVFVMLRRCSLEFAARRSPSLGPLPGIIGAGLIQESSLLSSCWNPRRWPLPEVIRSRLSSWSEAVITTWLAWCRVYDLRFRTTHFHNVVMKASHDRCPPSPTKCPRRCRREITARRSPSWGPLPGIIGAGLIQESSLLSSCWNPRRWPLPEVIRSRLSSCVYSLWCGDLSQESSEFTSSWGHSI